jgi:RHS repeat-associated protein
VLSGTTVLHYLPTTVNAQDYSAFGALLPGRTTGGTPRHTYNGKELDTETGWQDYGMRPYLGGEVPVFPCVDPLTKSYPQVSPYAFAMNRPIDGIDLDGLEWLHYKIQYKVTTDGKNIPLSKTTLADYRHLPEKQLNSIHKTTSFYSKYPQGFGKLGPGVLYTYEKIDDNGKVISSKDNLEEKSKLTRHGFYAGIGCITKSGRLITPGEYGNYDFGMMPIDMGDAISKEHDFLQNKEHHKGFSNTDYLNSDILFLVKMQRFKKDFETDLNYIDPFTGRKVSEESKAFANKAIELFQTFVLIKVKQLGADLDAKKISQKQYEESMFMLNNITLSEKAPMPKPTDGLNKTSN